MSISFHDEGIVIAKRHLGESKYIINVFTKNHGHIVGLIRLHRKTSLDLATVIDLSWQARLSEHLGFIQFEIKESFSFYAFQDYKRLLALQSFCTLLHISLAEGYKYFDLYTTCITFLKSLKNDEDAWQMVYVAFEKALLEHLGFGLDLKKCAVTGAKENLIYISPKTGRAVCEAAGLPYSQKLFPMTHLLSGGSEIIVEAKDFQESLRITGYFLKNFLLEADLPPARNNLAAA